MKRLMLIMYIYFSIYMNPVRRPRTTLSMPIHLEYHEDTFCDLYEFPIERRRTYIKTAELDYEKPGNLPKDSKDPTTFSNRYKEICQSLHIQPLNMVKVLLSNISLDITCDRIKYIDLVAILKTIQEDRSLHFISLKSKLKGVVVREHVDTKRKARDVDKVLYTRYMVNQISQSLRECIIHSMNLKALKLQGIPLGPTSVEKLSQGLMKTETLQHLSLQQCDVGDNGCLYLSRALRNVPTIQTLDLTSCRITSTGAKHIADLIKAQEIARFDQSWKQSLRYRRVNNEEMKGLRRVTLNDNPDIGDYGLKLIVDVLMDDFWIRALDVQNCGITDVGGALALELIQTNKEIGVVDLRRNPFVDNDIVASIVKISSDYMTPEKAEYGWLCIPKTGKNTSEVRLTKSRSSVFSYPWNSGPGRKKAKSLCLVDDATKTSIMKVKEWSESRGNKINMFSDSNTLMNDVEILNVEYAEKGEGRLRVVLEESPSNSTNTLSDSPAPCSTEQSDESPVGTTTKKAIDSPRAEDVEMLFSEFICSPQMEDESDLEM